MSDTKELPIIDEYPMTDNECSDLSNEEKYLAMMLEAKHTESKKQPSKEVLAFKEKFCDDQWNYFVRLPISDAQRIDILKAMENDARKTFDD